ncbi:inosine/xanthosine triphosphatase [Candidatus Bipolaricaulota bacterium]|nr:inosine/xanthosine triphosphatase [Candidatus Bipolaricaulota bacterium]
MLRISVGSENPVKLKASKEAFELARERVEVAKFDIPSGVSDQPTSDREAIKGARKRAKRAKRKGDFDFGVGLEGSVTDRDFGMFLTGWALLIDSEDSYLGGGGRLQLPRSIADRIRNGEELGPVMDEFTGRSGVKESEGAIGVFTNGIISRKEAYRNALVFALAKYLNPEFYS